MDQSIPVVTEIKAGTITFQVITHFQESGRETIGTKLIKLTEREQETHMTKQDTS